VLIVALLAVGLPRGLSIEWQAPPECPTAEVVRGQLAEALADAPAGTPHEVRGRLTRIGEVGWHLEISVKEGESALASQPPIEAGECVDLATEFVQRVQTLWALWTRPRPAARPRRVTGVARVGGRYGYGLLADQDFGGGQVVLGLVWRRLRLEAGVTADAALNVALPPKAVYLQSDWLRAGLLLRGCGELGLRADVVVIHLCGGAEVGAIGGRNVDGGVWNKFGPILNFHVAPALTWWFHRVVGLWAGVAAGAFVLRPRPVAAENNSPLLEESNFSVRYLSTILRHGSE